jgi:predicted component of type VI protein secretion system
MFALSIISLIHAGFTQRDAVSRAQLRWAISGFALGLGLFMLTFPISFNWITNPTLVNLLLMVSNLGFVVIGVGLAIAVLRYRLYDIDVIIRKTLVYAMLSGLLVLVYFGMVILLQTVFEYVSDQQSPIAIVISTLVIAALFNPLRQRVQAVIDRRLYRKKYDAQKVLAQFTQTARDETDMEVLQAELLRVVQETMQPKNQSVWIKPVMNHGHPIYGKKSE